MKISQLVAQLENLKAVHGDLEMSIFDGDMSLLYRLQPHFVLFDEEENRVEFRITNYKDETL